LKEIVMNYEKLTVDRFAANLKEGKYAALTGARRAIGKTSSWSAKDKEQAHVLANKHFGTNGVQKAAKSPKKAAAAAAKTEKAPKKMAKKAAKAPAAKSTTSAREMPPMPPMPKSFERAQESGPDAGDAIGMGHAVLGFLSSAREQFTFQKEMNPSGDYSRAVTAMDDAFTRAVVLVGTSIPTQGDPTTEKLPAARVSLPKEGPKKVTVTTQAPTPVSKATPTLPQPTQSAHGELTPAEQEVANALRNATPASTIAALPRPITAHD
jgi:hypothetical protein